MAKTLNPPHGTTVRATFIPFDRMTPRQRAEHLTMAHGMNADYWDHSTGEEPLSDDDDVIAWYLTSPHWVRPGMLAALHDDDHGYLAQDEQMLACLHTHTKEA